MNIIFSTSFSRARRQMEYIRHKYLEHNIHSIYINIRKNDISMYMSNHDYWKTASPFSPYLSAFKWERCYLDKNDASDEIINKIKSYATEKSHSIILF